MEDFVAIIESNLGSNKANQFITRQTNHQITRSNQYITHQITINYQNTSPSENPDPPNHHGGDYLNYLRLYLPIQATNIQVLKGSTLKGATTAADPLGQKAEGGLNPEISKITTKHGFKEIGLFHTTPHKSENSITISYQLPLDNQKTYQLSILKQPGIGSSPQVINLFNKTIKTNLTKDFLTQTTTL